MVNRLQKALEWSNIKLAAVVSDITGVSARAMLTALVDGQTEASVLAALAQGRLRSKRAALEQALDGRFADHHRFLLAQHLEHVDFLDDQIATFDQTIREAFEPPSTPEPPPPGAEHGHGTWWWSASR